ncbi:MAG: radical SAM protein [Firmicutes bacterium]|nr:radical SAM protein [Bacillota bacterium]
MKTINLFGHDIIVRDTLCSTDPKDLKVVDPSLRLYIKLTDACNADCLFCANKESRDFGNLDFRKLEFVIRYLLDKKLLHGISITGGEPMMNPDKMNMLLNLIYGIDPNMEVAISTNGYNLRSFLDMEHVNKLESIHISRHHYDDEVNYDIFGSRDVASTEDIIALQEGLDDKRIININTLVMKDYIEDLASIKRMLNYVGNVGVYKNGFVSLMKCNQFSRDHFINFNDIFSSLDESFYLGHHFYNGEYCECVDGVYLTDKDKMVEFYARMVKDCSCPYTTQLVYTSDNKVTAGFGKKLLYK